MADQTQRFLITRALQPAHYNDFSCIGGRCKDSCCKFAWDIFFNKKDYLKLKRAAKSPELQKKFEGSVKRLRGDKRTERFYAAMNLESGACPMLTGEGLCALQLECGADVLPAVCREFPRRFFILDTDYMERSVSPGCEAVLEQLWNLPDGLDFVIEPLAAAERYTVSFKQSDLPPLLKGFAKVRSFCIDVLQARQLPLSRRLLLLGLLLKDAAAHERDFDADAWFAKGEAMLHDPGVAQSLAAMNGDRAKFLENNLVALTRFITHHTEMGALARAVIGSSGCVVYIDAEGEGNGGDLPREYQINAARLPGYLERYEKMKEAFAVRFGDLEYFFENLMVTVLFNMHFPIMSNANKLWDSYLKLCTLYSLYRYLSVAACETDLTRERLFHTLTVANRSSLHNMNVLSILAGRLRSTGSDSLAHMAILLQE